MGQPWPDGLVAGGTGALGALAAAAARAAFPSGELRALRYSWRLRRWVASAAVVGRLRLLMAGTLPSIPAGDQGGQHDPVGPTQGLKYASLAMVTKAASDVGEESIRQSVSLFIWNQTSALTSGHVVFSDGRIPAIHAALSPPSSALAVSGIMIGFPVAARLA